MKTVFLRLLDSTDKALAIRCAICVTDATSDAGRYDVDSSRFSEVPRSPFAYWAPPRAFVAFTSMSSLGDGLAEVVSTNPLNDDFRYARSWWEIGGSSGNYWPTWVKGGSFSPYYYDSDTVITWDPERSTYRGFLGTENRPIERPASVQHFFRPGLTWPRRTQGGLSLRAMPIGCIFADKGPAVFVPDDSHETLLAVLAIANSDSFRRLVELQMAFGSYEVGVIQRTPIPTLAKSSSATLAALAHRAWALGYSLDTVVETSHAFIRPAVLQATGSTLLQCTAKWKERAALARAELTSIQEEIDEICSDSYGFAGTDVRPIAVKHTEWVDEAGAEAAPDVPSDEEGVFGNEVGSPAELASELMSWATGVAFGRFDVRVATGERTAPSATEPFDPLPACSPGMLTGYDDLPLTESPGGYPLSFPSDGVLVADPGHCRDLTTAVRAVFQVVFGAAADARWQEAAVLLDPKDRDLRSWLTNSFFEFHLKRYSKSRRKAPILWQLATPSASYSVWLYAHRLTQDSLFTVLNDHVAPKLQHEERKLDGLVQAAGGSPTAGQRKEIAVQEAFVQDLRAFRDEVARVAPLWNPDLDDGVIITMAPLWCLVPHHRTWQKELRGCWDRLAAGDYDWAHLAMYLWPERVVPKCQTDRSLAIAHGLEDAFWVEGTDGKWKPRKVEASVVESLIRERIRPAVKAALQSLEEAAATGARKERKRSVTRTGQGEGGT